MPRSKGSLSTQQAKELSQEVADLIGTPYKYNLDIMRLIELLICQRIVEQVTAYPDDTPITDKDVTVEIPLIGELSIIPNVFHESHGMTNMPSIHFDYVFKPTSAFKQDINRAFTNHQTELPEILTEVYSEKVREAYRKLREENV
jgi:hypothetical protein